MVQPNTVLLVEDNPADVRLTSEALHEAAIPCDLQVAHTGAEALEQLRGTGFWPALIILDLEMPGLSGFDVLAALAADDELREIPVAMLTSRDDDRSVSEAYKLGANCFLSKPRDLGDFVAVVRQLEEFWLGAVRLPGRPGGPGDPGEGDQGVSVVDRGS